MNDPFDQSATGIRSKLCRIEAIELSALGFFVALAGTLLSLADPADEPIGIGNFLAALILIEGAVFLLWGSYNLFIRLARAGGQKVDVGLWIIAAAATGSVTFWGWTVLDINRLIISRLFYRGQAPVEYAWSSKSKQVRKAWEAMRKSAGPVPVSVA